MDGMSQPIQGSEYQQTLIDEEEEEQVLDWDVAPSTVVARIETCTMWLIEKVSNGELPDLELPSLFPADQQKPPQTLSLLGRHVESADRYARLWSLLNTCHQNLVSGTTSTQRKIQYELKTSSVFGRPSKRNNNDNNNDNGSTAQLQVAIQDAVRLLRVPRSCLGITCSSKGLVAGAVTITNTTTGDVLEALFKPRPIPGNILEINELLFDVLPSVEAILLVEKDAVFQSLATHPALNEDKNIIFITGKGVPDVATRAFASQLHLQHPHLLILGLVDWNPSGVGILALYRYGSRRMVESSRYTLPTLHWMGVRSGVLGNLSEKEAVRGLQPLTPRDKSLIPGLKAQCAEHENDAWVEELSVMEQNGVKADIEAVYRMCEGGAVGFGTMVKYLLHTQQWI